MGRVARPESRSDFRHTRFIYRKQNNLFSKNSKSLKTGYFYYKTLYGAGRNPSPTENLPKILGLQRADIESAPTIFVTN